MSRGSISVAIVDDDSSVRKALSRLLSASSFPVQTFASAHDFMDSLAKGLPDCLILDINMPDLSGLDLYSYLRRTDRSVPTIIITGFGDADVRERCLASGVAAFFTKPLDGSELVRTVEATAAKCMSGG